MPFIDESFYVKSALTLAKTNHITYYGSSPMIGWQMVWGALWIRLAGFSFSGIRSSMLPFAGGAVWLMHSCLRRFRLGRRQAILGALTLGWSPLFVPLSTTFMTDIGALFGVLLCLWMCLRAVDAQHDTETAIWLSSATFVNLLLGTDRQIVLLGALVMVPATAWLLRRRRGVLTAGAIAWVVSLVTVQQALHWFSRQLGVRPIQLTGPVSWNAVGHALLQFLLETPLCLTLLVTPVAIFSLSRSSLNKMARLRLGGVVLLAAVFYGVLYSCAGPTIYNRAVMPWLTPIIGNLGILVSNDELPGVHATTLGPASRAALSLLTIAMMWSLLEQAWTVWRRRKETLSEVPTDFGRQTVFCTVGVFSLAYTLILIPTQLHPINGYFDRYLIFLIPPAVISILKLWSDSDYDRVPPISYAALAIVATYVVAATHDWYAMQRARVDLVEEISSTGVAKTAILAGWEYDAWTQMQAQEFINFKLMVRAPGVPYTVPPERKRPCERGLADWTPAIDPKFIITYSAVPCFVASEFEPERYRTWLPPFHRQVMAMRVPGEE